MNSEDFKNWLKEHKIGIRELSKILDVSENMLYKYKQDNGKIPNRFKYTLAGVVAERINKDKKRIKNV